MVQKLGSANKCRTSHQRKPQALNESLLIVGDISLNPGEVVAMVFDKSKSEGERRSGVDRRGGRNRRSGVDTRSEQEKRTIGERRSNTDRRSGIDRRVSLPSDPVKKNS